MIKRLFVAAAVIGLAISLVGVGLAAGPELDNALSRYPGAVLISNETLDWQHLDLRTLSRQATYQTTDALPRVRSWYAARLQISAASEQYLTGGDGCAWLSQAGLVVARLQHTLSVMVCPVTGGTRVVVNESVEW